MIISQNVNEIADILASGGIAAFSTDTLFSLSCDASNNEAVSKIYKMKRRPVHKALPLFIDSIESAKRYVAFDEYSLKIAKQFWPGPLTLILPLLNSASISPLVHRNSRCVGLRVPNAKLIRQVIKLHRRPIIATSANISGEGNVKSECELIEKFGNDVDVCAFDEKQHVAHIQSTIVKPIGDKIEVLRNGHIPSEKILKVI